jgi:hypothetical protein
VRDDVAGGVHPGADRQGEGQERQARLKRAAPEHVLQVQRGEQEQPEEHGGGGEHHHEAAADGAISEALDAQQRLAGVQLEHREGGQAGERRGAHAQRLRRRPAQGLGLRQGVNQRAEAGGGEERAAQVEAAPLGPRRVGGQQVRGAGREQKADRQVDEEDRAPVDELGEHAAEQDADGGAGAAHRTPGAQRSAARPPKSSRLPKISE